MAMSTVGLFENFSGPHLGGDFKIKKITPKMYSPPPIFFFTLFVLRRPEKKHLGSLSKDHNGKKIPDYCWNNTNTSHPCLTRHCLSPTHINTPGTNQLQVLEGLISH